MATRQQWIDMWLFGIRQLQEQATKSVDDDWPEDFRALVASVGTALVAYDHKQAEFRKGLSSVLDRLHAVAMAAKAEREGTTHVGSMLPIADSGERPKLVDTEEERRWLGDDEEERARRSRAETVEVVATVAAAVAESLTSGETNSLGSAETNSASTADTSLADTGSAYDSGSSSSFDGGGGGGFDGGGSSGDW